MFIYNVTTKVSYSIKNDWIAWVKQEHIPEIINTGCFTAATVLQLLETDDSEGPTYAVQYKAGSKALYDRYIEKFSGNMRRKAHEKWGEKIIGFNSLLQVIH